MANWYRDRYRRHLCDMHIDDWNDEFLSRFDPYDYYDNLRRAHVNMPMIYLQSHVGLCHFPVTTGATHRHFAAHPDDMKTLIRLCHAGGMQVMGYYSINFNTWAHDAHPEWAMLKETGKSRRREDDSRYGLCCPNNMDYRQFVYAQIRQMLEYFPEIDGIFYDMPFWEQVCYCPACRARWEKEHGGPIPVGGTQRGWESNQTEAVNGSKKTGDDWEAFQHLRADWMGEWAQAVADYTKACKPGIAVEFNYAAAISLGLTAGCGDAVNEATDYCGGDLYGGAREQSFACKFYRACTKSEPFEYMTSRCDPRLSVNHTVTKSDKKLELAVMLTCAHHGAILMIDAIDPRGTMDKRFYDKLGTFFRQEAQYEPYATGELVADVGVLYHLPSKLTRHGCAFGHHEAAVQAGTTLASGHIPYNVVTYRNLDELSEYPLLIVPMIAALSDAERQTLIDYVTGGGRLYLSGGEDAALLEALLCAKVEGFTEHTVTYLAPQRDYEAVLGGFNEDYPLPFGICAPLLSVLSSDCTVLAKLDLPYTTQQNGSFASIHSNPPGVHTDYPILVKRSVGKGTVLWSGLPIEQDGIEAFRTVFLGCLQLLELDPCITSDAPEQVELITFRAENNLRISCVKLEPAIPVLPGFTLNVRVKAAPKAVKRLPDETVLSFTFENGVVSFMTQPLDIYDLYEIIF